MRAIQELGMRVTVRDRYFTREEHDNDIRMVGTYWDMVCTFVKQGVLN